MDNFSLDDQSDSIDMNIEEEDLIPISNDHLSDEVRQAEIDADSALRQDKADLENVIQQMETEENMTVEQDDSLNNDLENQDEADLENVMQQMEAEEDMTVPQDDSLNAVLDADDDSHRPATTEQGAVVRVEGGPEMHEREVFNDIAEKDLETGRGGIERLG